MIKLPQHLKSPYEAIGSLLDIVPGGMTYDKIQSHISALRHLSKKDLVLLLEYAESRDRIVVTYTKQKDKPAEPHLQHKRHVKNSVEQVLVQPNFTGGEHVVHVQTPGRFEHSTKPNKPKLKEPIVENPDIVETIAPEEPIDFEKRRREYLGAEHLIKAAGDIMDKLSTAAQGLSRTELGAVSVGYNRLRGADRQVVLSYLVSREGLKEHFANLDGELRGVGRFFHPNFTEKLPEGEKRFDHTAPEITLDPIPEIKESVPEVKPVTLSPKETVDPIEVVRAAVLETLLYADNHALPLYEFHKQIAGFSDLGDNERKNLMKDMAARGQIWTYRANSYGEREEGGITWAKLRKDVESGEGNPVVKSTPAVRNTALSDAFGVLSVFGSESYPTGDTGRILSSMTDDSSLVKTNKPEAYPGNSAVDLFNAETKTGELPEEDDAIEPTRAVATLEEAVAPKSEVAEQKLFLKKVTPLSLDQVRQSIAQLKELELRLEIEEEEKTLIAAIKPLRDEIVASYQQSEAALSAQIDAMAAMGMAIERINQILDKK